MNKKNVIKKTVFTVLTILAAACLFMLSNYIISGGNTASVQEGFVITPFACAVIFMICTGAAAAIFIIDREKPLWFAAIYTAAVLAGIFLPLIKAFAG